MTEAEWLAATDPRPLIEYAREHVRDRKFRLFQVECCRWIWEVLPGELFCEAVTVAERYADGHVNDRRRQAVRKAVSIADVSTDIVQINAQYAVLHANEKTVGRRPYFLGVEVVFGRLAAKDSGDLDVYRAAYRETQKRESQLLRCLIGNPFRPVAFDPGWRTSAAVALAAGMYDTRDFAPMPILADALQEAGCDNPDVLAHCRDPNAAHVRGCWVVDGVLGKA